MKDNNNSNALQHIIKELKNNLFYNDKEETYKDNPDRLSKFIDEKPFLLPENTTLEQKNKIAQSYYGATLQTQNRLIRLTKKLMEIYPEEYKK